MDKSTGRNIILSRNLGKRQKLLLIDKSWPVFAKKLLDDFFTSWLFMEGGKKAYKTMKIKTIREYRKNVLYMSDIGNLHFCSDWW